MADPIFWLALSLLLVAVSLTAVLMAAVPALRELGRASRSAEKLFDTLNRELPPTLESIRLTGREITDLTEEVSEGVSHAGKVIQQVDQGVYAARQQAQQLQVGSRSLMAGLQAAWQAWQGSPNPVSQENRKPARKYSPEGRNLRSRPPATSRPTQPTTPHPHQDKVGRPQAQPASRSVEPKPRATSPLPPAGSAAQFQRSPTSPLPEPELETLRVNHTVESSHEITDVD